MNEVTLQNVLGKEITIFAGWLGDSRYAWSSKFFTKDCPCCPYCVGKEDALLVIQRVDNSKGRIRWLPPSEEEVMGLCDWGVWTKILVSREKGPRKCEFFDK